MLCTKCVCVSQRDEEKLEKWEAVGEENVAAATKKKYLEWEEKKATEVECKERETVSSVNLVTYFSSPPNRCTWPLLLFSITSGSDPFRRCCLRSLLLYQSLCHLSLHTSRVRDQHHPSTYRGRERKKRDFDFLMLFCETFQIKTEVISDWKPPETTVAPTHTPTHQQQLRNWMHH